jgi:hypothetical protein
MAVDAGAAGDADADAGVPSAKRRAYDNVSGKVSGRPWKAPFGRASSIGARPPSDWDAKMRAKEEKKTIQARRAARALRPGGAAADCAADASPAAAGGWCAGARRGAAQRGEGEGYSREEAARGGEDAAGGEPQGVGSGAEGASRLRGARARCC